VLFTNAVPPHLNTVGVKCMAALAHLLNILSKSCVRKRKAVFKRNERGLKQNVKQQLTSTLFPLRAFI
jgi:hypothetical protein